MSGYTIPENPTDAQLLEAYRTYSSPGDPGVSGARPWPMVCARRFHNLGPETDPELAAAYERLTSLLASVSAGGPATPAQQP